MAWLATDKNGLEYIYDGIPFRNTDRWYANIWINIPKGTIKKIIGYDLTWKDNPIELLENNGILSLPDEDNSDYDDLFGVNK